MEISLFASDQNTKAIRAVVSWEELCTLLSNPRPKERAKSSLPMWSPATFRGDERRSANVEQVCLLVFDVDEDPVPTLEEIGAALGEVRWFAHSSSNSTAVSPRWRLVLEPSRPLTPVEHACVWMAWSIRFPFKVGAQSKDCSRAWYAARSGLDGSFITSETMKGQLAATV